MFNSHVKGMEVPNVVVDPTIFYAGIMQLLADIGGEIALGNTFSGSVLCFLFVGFWLSLESIHIYYGSISFLHTLVNQIK